MWERRAAVAVRAVEAEMLEPGAAVLLVIDVQEAFRDRVHGWDGLVERVDALARGCRLLDVPVLVTEQYPRGLGRTVEELDDALAGATVLEKRTFSACGAEGFDDVLASLGRRQVVLCGIEAHVCVHQTAADLLARGLSVHAALDAISSQRPEDARIGELRLLADGARASSVELALFELLGTSTASVFRDVAAVVKELHAPVRTGSA